MTKRKPAAPRAPAGITATAAPAQNKTVPAVRVPVRIGPRNFDWTDERLLLVEDMAAELKLQGTIAAHFGLTLRNFEEGMALNKGHNDLRIAWERGRARAEQSKIDKFKELFEAADGSKMPGVTAGIFFMKAQFGWRDRPDSSGDGGPRITFVLPGSMPLDDYYAKLGIKGPVDGRTKRPEMIEATCGEVKVLPTSAAQALGSAFQVAGRESGTEAGVQEGGKLAVKPERPRPMTPLIRR